MIKYDIPRNIVPYFQPIIAIDTNKIYSYEVLGRYIDDDGTIKSLGAFFTDENTSDEEALKVDQIIRRKALCKYAKEGKDEYLFINIRLKWIASYIDNPKKMPTILWAKEYGISLNKLVIEITEEDFYDGSEAFTKALMFYKSMGCRIAVDDFGKKASNIDRLSELLPDIIKIDMSYIHKSQESYHYREYLKMITAFADRVGIEVLYEGIENQSQLDICISSKGRYYQGFLLAKPQPSINKAIINQDVFLHSSNHSILTLYDSSNRVNKIRSYWDALINNYFDIKPFNSIIVDMNDYLSELFLDLPKSTKRIYVCDYQGYQISYNIEKNSEITERNDYRNKNWAWRGYFQKAITAFSSGMKSYLTSEYRDATTKEKIYTYVCLFDTNMILHIDILKAVD